MAKHPTLQDENEPSEEVTEPAVQEESPPDSTQLPGIEPVPPPTVTAITITPDNPMVATGVSEQLTATATHADDTTSDVTGSVDWHVHPPEIATVDSNGLLTGTSPGEGTVQAVLPGSGVQPGTTALTVFVANVDHINVPLGGTCPKCGWNWGSTNPHPVLIPPV